MKPRIINTTTPVLMYINVELSELPQNCLFSHTSFRPSKSTGYKISENTRNVTNKMKDFI